MTDDELKTGLMEILDEDIIYPEYVSNQILELFRAADWSPAVPSKEGGEKCPRCNGEEMFMPNDDTDAPEGNQWQNCDKCKGGTGTPVLYTAARTGRIVLPKKNE